MIELYTYVSAFHSERHVQKWCRQQSRSKGRYLTYDLGEDGYYYISNKYDPNYLASLKVTMHSISTPKGGSAFYNTYSRKPANNLTPYWVNLYYSKTRSNIITGGQDHTSRNSAVNLIVTESHNLEYIKTVKIWR